MELNEAQKHKVKQILSHADGEDIDEIIHDVGFEDYLLRSLIMKASDSDLEYFLAERKNLHGGA